VIQSAIFAVAGYFAMMVLWRVAVTVTWRRRARIRAGRAAP